MVHDVSVYFTSIGQTGLTEPSAIMVGSTTEHDDKAGKEKAHYSDDLDRGENKFRFAIYLHGKNI